MDSLPIWILFVVSLTMTWVFGRRTIKFHQWTGFLPTKQKEREELDQWIKFQVGYRSSNHAVSFIVTLIAFVVFIISVIVLTNLR